AACHDTASSNMRSHPARWDRLRQVSRETSAVAIVIPVASADDPRLTVYRRLTDADHRRRVEDATGTFVVEGVTAIRRALTSPYSLRSLLLTAPKAQTLAPDLAGVDVDTYVVAQDVMNTVAGFDLHRRARRTPPGPTSTRTPSPGTS